jgi:hypothetical protein
MSFIPASNANSIDNMFNAKRGFVSIDGDIHYINRISMVNMQKGTFTAHLWGKGEKNLNIHKVKILGVLEHTNCIHISDK